MEIWFIFGQLPFWQGILVFFASRLSSGRGFLKSSLVPLRITLSCVLLVFPFTVLSLLLSITNLSDQLTQLLLKSTYSDTLHVMWQATLDVISAHVLDANTKQTNMKTSQLPVSREKCNSFLVENKSRVLVAPPIPLQHSFPAEVGKNKLQMTY